MQVIRRVCCPNESTNKLFTFHVRHNCILLPFLVDEIMSMFLFYFGLLFEFFLLSSSKLRITSFDIIRFSLLIHLLFKFGVQLINT